LRFLVALTSAAAFTEIRSRLRERAAWSAAGPGLSFAGTGGVVHTAWRRIGIRLAAIVAAAVLLTGCVSIGARLLLAVFDDPRTRNHAYNLKVEFSFRMGEQQLKVVRYAEVGYLTGKGSASYQPLCDREKRYCWYINEHYFVGLPNGDIIDVYLENKNLPLDRWPEGQATPASAHVTSIHRDQKPSPHTDSQGTCRDLNSEVVQRDYGLPPNIYRQPDLKFDVTLTKVRDRDAKVIDEKDIYTAMIIDEVSCKRLHGRLSKDVTVTPVAAP
jgi:hypothetical protein